MHRVRTAQSTRCSSRGVHGTCTASSRVGANASTIGPSPLARNGCALMCTIAGSRYASVFPEPVCTTALRFRSGALVTVLGLAWGLDLASI